MYSNSNYLYGNPQAFSLTTSCLLESTSASVARGIIIIIIIIMQAGRQADRTWHVTASDSQLLL